ncbi:MAG: hypothetical protein PHE49_00825 [bacterium]|nr:hypothetical protein [bacterium]
MGIREKLKYAFAVQPEEDALTPEEEGMLDNLAIGIRKRRFDVIAITFLESVKYLNFIGSQAMLFFEPIIDSVFPNEMYPKIRKILEKRCSIEYLIQKIESLEISQKKQNSEGVIKNGTKNNTCN